MTLIFFVERRRSVSESSSSSWNDQCFTNDEESIVRLIGSRSPFEMGCKFVINLSLLLEFPLLSSRFFCCYVFFIRTESYAPDLFR